MYKEIELNGRTIKYRKWKVKDKRALDNADSNLERRKIFVYGCLEDPNTPLDLEEYNYVLALIRDYSLHNTLNYALTCPECGHSFTIGKTSAQVVQPMPAVYDPIVTNSNTIDIGNVRDQKIYEEKILKCLTPMERYITDFALHIYSINGSDITTIENVIDFLENLDVDEYENIFAQWDIRRFKCNVIHPTKCPSCNAVSDFDFSDMPEFFPTSWEIS